MLSMIPQEERPRERLERHGSGALSLVELLAICLVNGTVGQSVLSLAEALLARFQTLEALSDATLSELMEVKGIGRVKGIKIQWINPIGKS